jgi:hypothetical protein
MVDRSKIGRSNRQKGKRGEREVRDIFQALIYPNGEGTVSRTPHSGAWHGMPILTGDLVFLKDGKSDNDVLFFCEVKTRQKGSISFANLLSGDSGTIGAWVKTAKGNCPEDKIAIVVWKIPFSEWFVSVSHLDTLVLMDIFGSMPIPSSILMTNDEDGVATLPWDTFSRWVKK